MTPAEILDDCKHVVCRRCGGRGSYDKRCSFCDDSTHDHICDDTTLACEDCKGTGRGPNPCRPCVERAIAEAVIAERDVIVEYIRDQWADDLADELAEHLESADRARGCR